MNDDNYVEAILGILFFAVVVAIIALLIADANQRSEAHNGQELRLLQDTGAVHVEYGGRLSSDSAVNLWVVTYSEKPSQIYACVGLGKESACQLWKVQP